MYPLALAVALAATSGDPPPDHPDSVDAVHGSDEGAQSEVLIEDDHRVEDVRAQPRPTAADDATSGSASKRAEGLPRVDLRGLEPSAQQIAAAERDYRRYSKIRLGTGISSGLALAGAVVALSFDIAAPPCGGDRFCVYDGPGSGNPPAFVTGTVLAVSGIALAAVAIVYHVRIDRYREHYGVALGPGGFSMSF